ncbi:hypothetical protein HK102_007036, partial [Quaeritorhiza haematococci]
VSDSKSSRLADLFRPPFDLMFQGGDFDTARGVARSENKWIMITISEPSEFACQVMNRDLWKDEGVKEVVREQFVFIYYGSESPEGKRHITYYPITSYPYVAIIDPLTSERVKTWNVAMSPGEFLQEVTEFLESRASSSLSFSKNDGSSSSTGAAAANGGNSINEPKSKKAKSIADLTEEEQLRMALAASMEDVVGGVDDFEDLEGVEGGGGEVDAFDTISPVVGEEPGGSGGDVTRVQFRLPDGQRVVRKFMKTDKVRRLYEFVKGSVGEAEGKKFELMAFREGLINKLEQTLAEANVLNGVVMMDYL